VAALLAPEQGSPREERRRVAPHHLALERQADGAWAAGRRAASQGAEALPDAQAAMAADEARRSAFPDVAVMGRQGADRLDAPPRRVRPVSAPLDDSDSRSAPEMLSTVSALAVSRAPDAVAAPAAPDRFSDLQLEAGSLAARRVLSAKARADVAAPVSLSM